MFAVSTIVYAEYLEYTNNFYDNMELQMADWDSPSAWHNMDQSAIFPAILNFGKIASAANIYFAPFALI